MSTFASMLNRLHGQPESYKKKSQYKFGRALGSGTYGVVYQADGPGGLVAIKTIPKKNVKGNEQMVYDELHLLQRLKHPHIVKFVDWFESREKFYIVTELATGGELFDRICEQGKFTEKDASQTIKQVLDAVHYLHNNNVVHRDLKPENLIYTTPEADSDLVLADFGIAKTLGNDRETLNTMAGSFGYAAPEVMERQGHGKPVDMWSLGVITYTLLCGYSPFRSENLTDLITECKKGEVIFHERYWKDVSSDAKDFINGLIAPDPDQRWTSEQALGHIWISGKNATEHDLLPELRPELEKTKAIMARRKFKHAILAVRLNSKLDNAGWGERMQLLVKAKMEDAKAEREAEEEAGQESEASNKEATEAADEEATENENEPASKEVAGKEAIGKEAGTEATGGGSHGS